MTTTNETKKTARKPGFQASAKDLVPNLATAGVKKRYYWVGLLMDCPVDCIDAGGVSFPKGNDLLQPSRKRPGSLERVGVNGSLVPLDEEQVQAISKRVKQTVIRLRSEREIGDVTIRYGQLIQIPTEKDLEERRKAGRAVNRYSPSPNDEPAAKYMYCAPAEVDQNGTPFRGAVFPPTLAEAGLEWPPQE